MDPRQTSKCIICVESVNKYRIHFSGVLWNIKGVSCNPSDFNRSHENKFLKEVEPNKTICIKCI